EPTGVSSGPGSQVPAQKKIKQTDAIFARLHEMNPEADQADNVLRLSLDAKAAVKSGLFSRGGKSRVRVEAADHDFRPDAVLVPFGILLPRYDDLYLYFTHSPLTSHCLVDVLEARWRRGGRRLRRRGTP